jgi:hypothetical protein
MGGGLAPHPFQHREEGGDEQLDEPDGGEHTADHGNAERHARPGAGRSSTASHSPLAGGSDMTSAFRHVPSREAGERRPVPEGGQGIRGFADGDAFVLQARGAFQ